MSPPGLYIGTFLRSKVRHTETHVCYFSFLCIFFVMNMNVSGMVFVHVRTYDDDYVAQQGASQPNGWPRHVVSPWLTFICTVCNGQIFVYFENYLPPVSFNKCERWFFAVPNFAKPYQTSKPGSRNNFWQTSKLIDFAISTSWSERKRQSFKYKFVSGKW